MIVVGYAPMAVEAPVAVVVIVIMVVRMGSMRVSVGTVRMPHQFPGPLEKHETPDPHD